VTQQSDAQPEDVRAQVHSHERRVAASAFAQVRRPDFDERSCRRSHGGSVQGLGLACSEEGL
jgi:cation transport regulator ChaB